MIITTKGQLMSSIAFDTNKEWLIRAILVMSSKEDFLRAFSGSVDMENGHVDWKSLGDNRFSERDLDEEFFRLGTWALAFYSDSTPDEETKNELPWVEPNIIGSFRFVSHGSGDSIIKAFKHLNGNQAIKDELRSEAIKKWRRATIR